MTHIKMIAACFMACGLLGAQSLQKQDENATRLISGEAPIYRVNVTAGTVKAISYQHRSGSTKIDFEGTSLLPEAGGEAKVASKQGYIEIDAKFNNLKPANALGAEYLTYVLWAITPEGRTANLGEILLNGSKSKIKITTEMQVFGLVVTAEPYFSVTRPSDLIVMENVVRSDTKGRIEQIDAKYELLERGQYAKLANPLNLGLDKKIPLELYEARNAVQIARSVGADQFAAETFQKAETTLAQAEAYQARNAGKKPVTMTARQAVQTAEDARAIAVKRQEDEAVLAARQQAEEREAQAEASRAAAQLEAERVTREAEAAQVRAREDATRAARESEASMLVASAEADQMRREMEAQRAANAANLESAERQRSQFEAEKLELRKNMLEQLNAVLQTQDSARGLILNMSDVLFGTAQHTLLPQAREKLAKVAGIISSHPGLNLAVEGHTDSVGGESYNQLLSERRGASVRDYLVQQGVPAASVSTKGLGKGHPIASNESAAGRQQNRRVEIVISGEAIGTTIGRVF